MLKFIKTGVEQIKTFLFYGLFLTGFLLSFSLKSQITADFSANKTEGCAPLIVKLTDNSSGTPSNWQWSSSAGVSSDKQNPTLIFPNPGVFSITLIAGDGTTSSTVTKEMFVRVLPGLTVDFSAFQPSGCAPLTSTFNDLSVPQSSPIVKWFWSFENGQTSTVQNPSMTFDKNQAYDVLLKVTDANGCEASLNKENFVNVSGPKADFIFDSVACSLPASIAFLNTSSGNNLIYEWDFGNGVTSNQDIPGAISYTNHDTLPVKLKVQEQGTSCADSISKMLYIRNFDPQFDVKAICNLNDFSIELTDKTTPTPTSVHWDLGDGTESISNSVSHAYADKTEKTIVFTASLSASCVNTKTLKYSPPVAMFTADIPLSCSNPFPVNFNNSSTGTDLNYDWNFGDSTINSTVINPSHDYAIPPVSFFPTLTVTDKYNCIDSMFLGIGIPKPLASIFTENDKTKGCIPLTINFIDSVTNLASPIKTISWDFGDPSSGAANFSNSSKPSHTYNSPGKYDVKLIVELQNTCTDTVIIPSFIAAGTLPDNVDFNINFSDTICYNNSLDFIGLTSYSNPTYSADYFCWSFEEDINALLTGNETPPIDCPNGPSAYKPSDKTVHTQNPTHLYSNYQYNGSGNVNGYNFLGQITTDSELLYTHLISGFNGCYEEAIKPVYVHNTAAMVGFAFSDFNYSLTACDTNKTIGIYNASQNYDSLAYFHIIYTPLNDTVQTISEKDTVYFKFNQYGDYAIEIAVYNKTNRCFDYARRTFQVVKHEPKMKLTDVFCKNLEVLAIDESSFSKGTQTQQTWTLNGIKYKEISFPALDADSLLIAIPDTGWNYIASKTIVGVTDSLLGEMTNDVACFYEVKDTIYIHGIEANVTVENTIACSKDSVLLKNYSASTSPQKNISWYLINDNSTIGNIDTIKTAYDSPGYYQFKAVLENDFGCIDSAVTDSLLVSIPSLAMEPQDTVACENDLINFKNKSVGNSVTFKWTIENSTYTNTDVTHQFNNVGKFDVKLFGIDQYSCKDSITYTDTIRIAAFPDAEFKALDLVADCPPFSIQFLDTSAYTGNQWEWKVNGVNFSNNQNYLHTFITPGKYDIEFINTSPEGCAATSTKSQYVEIKGPSATSSFSSSNVCVPDSVDFYMEFKDTEYFVWDFNDGVVQSDQVTNNKDTLTHYYKFGNVFSPILTVIDTNDCSITISTTSSINVDSLNPDFSYNNLIACSTDSIVFENNSSSYFSSSFDWNFGDGSSSSDSIPNHTYSTQNTYDVKLVMKNSIACKDSVTKSFVVYQDPEESLTVSNDYFCVPITTEYSLTFADPTIQPDQVYFNFEGTVSNGSKVKNTYTITGSYNVGYHLEYGNGACKIDSNFVEIYYELPTASFDYSPKNISLSEPQINFQNYSTKATIYNWSFGDGSNSPLENTLHTYNAAKEYSVKLIASNAGGCKDSITQKIPVAPYDLIRLPNAFSPDGDGVNDNFGILFAGDMSILSFEIYNRWGNLLFKAADINDKWDGTFGGQLAEAGPYLYYIRGQLINGESKEYKGDFLLIR